MAPDLVLLHGFTQTGRSWRPVLDALGGRRAALAPDMPGHGVFHARRPASFAATDAYLAVLAEPAAGGATLCGYSMGGRIALHAALSLGPRVRQLVLIGASPGLPDPAERAARRASDDALADRIEAIGVEAFAHEWARLPLWDGQPEHVRRAAHAERMRNTPDGLAAALRGLGTGVMPSLWDRLGEIAVPVLLVVGERDEKFRGIAARMAERLPDAAVHVVPGVGHAVQLEAPEAVAGLL
jgi:2-succinyl-6-hydroxy-2,4-cyclohexadiene-1-carboxylate synthase